ncbi:endo alpha-1,4 polygalactosaminidase [Sorangium sp. So ce136]|uniref:endo alpha-1,4 polygalactosaminidase n=1 Tax=Sorangium sp. So ce136 TaxID=3133284 RepID=UPI003EFD9C2A
MNRSWPAVVNSLILVLSAAHVACGDPGEDAGGAGGARLDSSDSSSTPASTSASSTSASSTSASSTSSGGNPDIWIPALETSWHWMIDHPLDVDDPMDMGLVDPTGAPIESPPPTVYDIDWEFTPAETVAALHARGAKVICYVDVGAFEDYRPDAGDFPESVKGNPDYHWEGSFWLDIRQIDVLGPIMQARFQACKDKGFDAIEPDEVDGYANDSGFPLTYDDQIAYNRFIADLAHAMGMSVGLKGDIEQAEDLWPHFDWTLNEQCFEYEECEILVDTFLANGKAVFEVEYDDPFSGHMTDRSLFCDQANAWGFNSMEMPLDLDGGRWPCR